MNKHGELRYQLRLSVMWRTSAQCLYPVLTAKHTFVCAILCYVDGQTSKYPCCFCAEYWNWTAWLEALWEAPTQAKESAAIVLHWNKCRWR